MIELECVSKALRLATTAHKGQTDKGGTDYIKHPIAVAECFDDEEGQIVALLHDTIEDTEITVENLRAEGFSDAILNAICCLTKKKDESRDDYLQRVAENSLATKVKIADLAHNSDLSRITFPTEKDFARVEKYTKEVAFLKATRKL